jgi:hypothetical protein
MNDNKVLSIELMTELHNRLGIDFESYEYLDDDKGGKHLYFIADVRGAKVYFDKLGQIWMTEAEIVRAIHMSESAVKNAIQRLTDSNLGEAICVLHRLYSTDRRGHKRLMTFYDEETVAAIITRGRDQSAKALEFLAERKHIIQTVRYIVFSHSLSQREKNQALLDQLEEEKQLRLTAERRVEDAEQNANDAQRELLEMRYGDLDAYD